MPYALEHRKESQRVWQENHREEQREYGKIHYQENRQICIDRATKRQRANPEAKRLYDQNRRTEKREEVLAVKAAYRESRREELRLKAKVYYQGNKEQAKVASKTRHSRKKGAWIGPVTVELLQMKLHYWGGTCWICRVKPFEHWDHVKPLSKGGAHCLSNLRPACASCNLHKHASWPLKLAS